MSKCQAATKIGEGVVKAPRGAAHLGSRKQNLTLDHANSSAAGTSTDPSAAMAAPANLPRLAGPGPEPIGKNSHVRPTTRDVDRGQCS